MTKEISQALHSHSNPDKARVMRSFFKTGKGQYGEGDLFIGVTVPQQRKIARQFLQLGFDEIAALLQSPIHEERLTAVLILVEQFKRADECGKTKIYVFYMKHTKRINNWDLVDLSAYHIVGAFLDGKDKSVLETLAKSKNIWERRIAMVATFHEIKKGESDTALFIARKLLNDQQDLMHKAVGWMLREVGKRASQEELEAFLNRHGAVMPRTTLRYAIERFPQDKRQHYLKALVD